MADTPQPIHLPDEDGWCMNQGCDWNEWNARSYPPCPVDFGGRKASTTQEQEAMLAAKLGKAYTPQDSRAELRNYIYDWKLGNIKVSPADVMAKVDAYVTEQLAKSGSSNQGLFTQAQVDEAEQHGKWLGLNNLKTCEETIEDRLGKLHYVVSLESIERQIRKYRPWTEVEKYKYGTTSKELEDAKRIHAPVIATMHEMGYGLMKDGDTFYRYGTELLPFRRDNFNMTQAYEIHNQLTTQHKSKEHPHD